jgi:RHS repeat-associated protein
MLASDERTACRAGSLRDRLPRVKDGGYADYDGDGDVDANDRGEITGLTCGGSNPSGACRVLDLDFDLILDARPTRLYQEREHRRYGEPVMCLCDEDTKGRGEITGLTCGGSNPSGACRVLDLDFDNDCDTDDATVFDSLPHTGTVIHPARRSSLLGQPFAHQGLFLDPEIAGYQNRARQYGPGLRRFVQRDPLALLSKAGGGFRDGLNMYAYVCSGPLRHVDPMGLAYDPDLPPIGDPCDTPGAEGPCNVRTCCSCGYPRKSSFGTTIECRCETGSGGLDHWTENCGHGEWSGHASGCKGKPRPAKDSEPCRCADAQCGCPAGLR